jgi:HTH-type transcriptional regulator/antitoxin HipB
MDQIARTPKQIGDALRRRRRQLAITQTDLSGKTKLRQATVSAVEAGEPRTQLRTLCALIAALDLELVIRPRSKGVAADEIEDIF